MLAASLVEVICMRHYDILKWWGCFYPMVRLLGSFQPSGICKAMLLCSSVPDVTPSRQLPVV